MVTPLNEDYTIDKGAVERIVNSFIRSGCAPFILGTTGEAASLSTNQKLDLVKYTVAAGKGKTTIFAGISGTSLLESGEQAKAYHNLGVDVVVTTLPYYYPITSAEMEKFFLQLANNIACPLVLYNMPAMVGASIPLEVADRLSQHPMIIGMKDSERDIDRINNEIQLWKDRDDFAFYIGWAAQSAHSVLQGADGIVPSTANFTPDLFRQLYDAALAGDSKEANRLQELTDEISLVYQKGRKLNTSLPALKVLMSELDLCKSYPMPPMYKIQQDDREMLINELHVVMKKTGISTVL